ncbi:mCG144668, partial [Mus musculus]
KWTLDLKFPEPSATQRPSTLIHMLWSRRKVVCLREHCEGLGQLTGLGFSYCLNVSSVLGLCPDDATATSCCAKTKLSSLNCFELPS